MSSLRAVAHLFALRRSPPLAHFARRHRCRPSGILPLTMLSPRHCPTAALTTASVSSPIPAFPLCHFLALASQLSCTMPYGQRPITRVFSCLPPPPPRPRAVCFKSHVALARRPHQSLPRFATRRVRFLARASILASSQCPTDTHPRPRWVTPGDRSAWSCAQASSYGRALRRPCSGSNRTSASPYRPVHRSLHVRATTSTAALPYARAHHRHGILAVLDFSIDIAVYR